MPISETFRCTLYPRLRTIADHFGTPFHIYDEAGIRHTARDLFSAFERHGLREYFAVKALPNPAILAILRDEGCGFDCSSVPELLLARQVGAQGEDILFTSNNTTPDEFAAALRDGGSILNLDDISLLSSLPETPELLSFRYNPGGGAGNAIIGLPEEAKFGVPQSRIIAAYRQAQALGIKRFGLHAMVVSNERRVSPFIATLKTLLTVATRLQAELAIQIEFINLGGGLGIPYRPDDASLDLWSLASKLWDVLQGFEREAGYRPRLLLESGRYMTGAHGVLVTQAINHKESYRHYIGVDASMSALMRPGMYGAYHHIDVPGKSANDGTQTVDIVGSLCENNDKFAIQRDLPPIERGDLLIIHDTGAHGHAMGFNYNGRLRPQELLLRPDGCIERIRRAETIADYFATLTYESNILAP